MLNPRRAGSAQASQGVIADIGIRARGDLTVAQAYAARDVINSHGLAAGLGASRFCTDKRRRAALEGQLQAVGFTRVQARGVIGDLVALLCQRGRLARIGAARRRLENRGVAAPSCSGTVARFGAGRSEVRAAISCSEATRAVVLRAQAGNPGVNCLPPQGAACDFGPSCRGQQEDVCFGSNPSFPPLTLIEGNAAWRDEVPNPGGVLDVSGSSFSPNPDAPASGIYLFRYTGPGAAPR